MQVQFKYVTGALTLWSVLISDSYMDHNKQNFRFLNLSHSNCQ